MEIIDVLALGADELETEIARHNDLYWNQATPEVDDTVYDAMVERLRSLRPDSKLLDQVGGGAAELDIAPATKVEHAHPMLSLDKCYGEEDLLKWFDRFEGPAFASHKIDGVAMSIRYDADGNLDLAATRGNGRIGELITENARGIGDVPSTVPVAGLEVRGEAYMPISVFQARFAEQFANPRNLTAGAIKLKDAPRTAEYGLRFFAYDALGLEDAATEREKRERLSAMGFVPAPGAACTREDAQATYDQLAAHRTENDFETDGIVYKVDDLAQYAALGMTAHHPRGAIAYKYQGESGLSTFETVEWNVSRSGSVNPVARVAPISLSGVTVTRVSLHNLAIIEKLAGATLKVGENADCPLAAGASVLVTRRGGVIPHIEALATPSPGPFSVPTECPDCGAPTERRGDFLFADHTIECTSQGTRAIEHFVKVVDIQGFGPKILEQLWIRDMVRTPADLFTLTVEQLQELDRLGRRSAQNLIDQVDAHRRIPLWQLLAALGIPDLGGQIARFIEASFALELAGEAAADGAKPEDTADAPPPETDEPDAPQTDLFALPQSNEPSPLEPAAMRDPLARVRAATAERFAEIDGIGPIVSQKIVDGLADRAELIDALLEHVEVFAEAPKEIAAPEDSAIVDKSFVFTGTLEAMTRGDAQERVRALGGTTPSGVSSKLDFLVIGDADFEKFQGGWRSSKLKKAEKIQQSEGATLEIIPESRFLELIGDA